MPYLRLTLLRPRPSAEADLQHLLEDLDRSLADAPGLLFSFVLSEAGGRFGRVSLWLSKEDANREATSPHILSLRSHLRYLSVEHEETLLQVESGYLPSGFNALIDAGKQPAFFPSAERQPTLPA
jgi:hypothetical protein